jgi:hypothetical protein
MPRLTVLALCLALPAMAQTTTTVTTQQAPSDPPPPPSTTTTTVTSDPGYVPPPPPRTTVRSDDDVGGVTVAPSGRSAVAIIATDSLYGGVAGVLVGAGITLIDNGNNWGRNLMVGAGVGILVGAAYGIYEAASQPPARRGGSQCRRVERERVRAERAARAFLTQSRHPDVLDGPRSAPRAEPYCVSQRQPP